jgi:hypothetical protein
MKVDANLAFQGAPSRLRVIEDSASGVWLVLLLPRQSQLHRQQGRLARYLQCLLQGLCLEWEFLRTILALGV